MVTCGDSRRRGTSAPAGTAHRRRHDVKGRRVRVTATPLAVGDGLWWDLPLTSGWLLLFLLLMVVAVTVLAGVTWDVPRYKRLRRSGLLLLTQFFVIGTLAAGANMAGGFYASLADVFGVRHIQGPVTQSVEKPVEKVANVEPWLAEARKGVGPGKGVWAPMSISGRRTGYQLPAWVYVPDAYFDVEQPDRKFPVVMLLAGFPGAVENWERQGHMVPVLDRLIAEGKIPPMILISVSQNPEPSRDSECVDAAGGAKADTYITQDATEAISQHFRVVPDRSGWSMMGYSTGGYCAVSLALRHPERFSAAISLDGYFEPALDATTGDLFKKDAALQRSYTPLQTIHDKRDLPLKFYLMVGDAEARSKQAARSFAGLVRPPDTTTIVDVPGGHNWNTWNSALPGALSWLAKP
jgi:enterochelin esterase-like enzyme